MTKILVVDDDATVLMTTQALLEDAGYEVIIRNGAFGTSQAVLQHRPDAVVLDVEMPGLSGRDLAKLLNELPRMQAALFLYSGMDRAELDRIGAEVGALGVFQKSMSPRLLLQELKTLLDHWSRRTSQTIGLRDPLEMGPTPRMKR